MLCNEGDMDFFEGIQALANLITSNFINSKCFQIWFFSNWQLSLATFMNLLKEKKVMSSYTEELNLCLM